MSNNNKQQTAVEWLREQFHKVPQSQFGNLFDEAKAKEKEQQRQWFVRGFILDQEDMIERESNLFIEFQELHNETYEQ